MTVLPDISREAKIVSGKDMKVFNSNSSNLLASTSISYEMAPNDLSVGDSSATKEEGNEFAKSKVMIKKKPSFNSIDKQLFPNLMSNDGKRSSAYQRLSHSSDYINVKNSPIATRLIYNWKPLERLPTKVVQAKVKIYKPSKRIDMPARPPSPYKVKTEYETVEPHFHNEKRALEMKRMQYLKEHTTWSVYPYGAIEEREGYNKKIRETLKEQMDQRDRSVKKEFDQKILEYKMVALQDEMSIQEDKRKRIEKFNYLKKFTNENKQNMENRWMHDYILKRHEWQQESQLLEQDPINWSKTLK